MLREADAAVGELTLVEDEAVGFGVPIRTTVAFFFPSLVEEGCKDEALEP
jgi:hypothetical protein